MLKAQEEKEEEKSDWSESDICDFLFIVLLRGVSW